MSQIVFDSAYSHIICNMNMLLLDEAPVRFGDVTT
jgi:hypothetical protein